MQCAVKTETRRLSNLYIGGNAAGSTMVGSSTTVWLACWTQAQKGPGSDRSCDAVW